MAFANVESIRDFEQIGMRLIERVIPWTLDGTALHNAPQFDEILGRGYRHQQRSARDEDTGTLEWVATSVHGYHDVDRPIEKWQAPICVGHHPQAFWMTAGCLLGRCRRDVDADSGRPAAVSGACHHCRKQLPGTGPEVDDDGLSRSGRSDAFGNCIDQSGPNSPGNQARTSGDCFRTIACHGRPAIGRLQ